MLRISRQLIETGKFPDHGFHPDYDKPVLQVYKEVRILSPICRTPGRVPLPREILNLIHLLNSSLSSLSRSIKG